MAILFHVIVAYNIKVLVFLRKSVTFDVIIRDPSFCTMPNHDKNPLTVKECAVWLRVSVNTLNRWIEQGIIPCWRIGKITRIDPDEALASLHAYRNRPKREALNA
jgi:excisionase family DNA binding protein